MSNGLVWNNVTPTIDSRGSSQQSSKHLLQSLEGLGGIIKDQESRTERMVSKEKDENSVAALEALLSTDDSDVANFDIDQFGRMTAEQKQKLLLTKNERTERSITREQGDNSAKALEALLSADARDVASFDHKQFGRMTAEQEKKILLAKDARASELLTRLAADQLAINTVEGERLKTATNEFWSTHGDEVEAELRNGNIEGARARIVGALSGEDGRMVSAVWDRFNSRQVALEKHQETIAEHRSRAAIAEHSLDITRQASSDDNISRSLQDASSKSGLAYRAETHKTQSDLINRGIQMEVLDDKGNLLPGVSAEKLVEYEAMVAERIGGLGSEQLQTLVDEANRITDPTKRENTIQQIRKNFMTELELTSEEQKGFIAETEALDRAKTLSLQEVDRVSKQIRKDNWFYDSKYDERTAVEKITAITDVFSGLGDKATDWAFSNRNELMDLVTHGLDIGGGVAPVRITPEIIKAFVTDRGYRNDNYSYHRTQWNSAAEAHIELGKWINEPANKRLIIEAEKAYGNHQDSRRGIENQYLAETAGINQRIRSAQGFEGGQNLNVLLQQLRGAKHSPDAVVRNIMTEDDPWVRKHITNQLNQEQNTARISQVSQVALEMAREYGINTDSSDVLNTYWETAENAVMTSGRENARLVNDMHNEFSQLTRQVGTLETQINSGLERLHIKKQIEEIEAELETLDPSDARSFSLRPRLARVRRLEGERMREWSGAPKSEEALMRLVESRDGMMSEITSLESQLKQLIR